MSDYVRGLLTVPAALVALVALGAILIGVVRLSVRVWPAHWVIAGPQRKRRMSDPRDLFRGVNAAGRHIGSFRRLVAAGPWTLYVARYRPGNVDEDSDPTP